MKGFFSFMASKAGRWLRIGLGIILIGWGIFFYNDGQNVNWLLVILGFMPLLAGIFDVCLLAPLFGFGFKGRRVRGETAGHE